MDINQVKLNKSEWDSIEIPVSKNEVDILNMIINGYNDVNIKINMNNSLISFLKIEYSEKIEDFIFNKYFREIINDIIIKYKVDFINIENIKSNVQLKNVDKIRLENNNADTISKDEIYEYVLIEQFKKFIEYRYYDNYYSNQNKLHKKEENNKKYVFHFFTLCKLIKNNVKMINRHVLDIINTTINHCKDGIEMLNILENSVECIEKNKKLLKYGDIQLYEHQKEIFMISKNTEPKLILYMAPTGTGKTLTPLALSQQYKVVFVCAARHVGLALARAAISVNKKIAFAFNCESAGDIRLHYYSAKEYSINKRSGGIGKVDNSVGDNVEIMICDLKSYLPAMYYMKAFNSEDKLLLYWDEPTITLDYKVHEHHNIIKNNWKNNIIHNIVLSSATLPKINEIIETVDDFKHKFKSENVYNIVSHDCKKSIPIINKDGYVVLPHYFSLDYSEIKEYAKHCEENLTLSRYFDLKEIVDFIVFVNKNNYINNKTKISRYFESIDDINMSNIKIYYIKALNNILPGTWGAIYTHFISLRKTRIPHNEMIDNKGNRILKTKSIGPGTTTSLNKEGLSGKTITRLASEQININNVEVNNNILSNPGIYITTKDAFTLTDGPTIFLSNDVEKIAKFCIQQANIPSVVMEDLMSKIEFNNRLNEKVDKLQKELEFITEKNENIKLNSSNNKNKSTKDIKKFNRDTQNDIGDKNEMNRITNEINIVRSMIKSAILNETFVPNKLSHIKKWAENLDCSSSFTSNIDENIINEIMLLNGIEDTWKVLLMMGIGVFTNHKNTTYTEIMKKLADSEKLYIIIASSDYIYGTNYQFCHAYLSKDLDLTQEKIIQALGRVGRNNIQQNYTLRFRDDNLIMKLFKNDSDKPEIKNMNLLFTSTDIEWNGTEYIKV
jgi:hypothetical protein